MPRLPLGTGQSYAKAFCAGIRWGIGHSAGLIVMAIVFYSFKASPSPAPAARFHINYPTL